MTFPVGTGLNPSVSPSQNVEQLTVLAEQVLGELRLGKQASSYKWRIATIREKFRHLKQIPYWLWVSASTFREELSFL